MEILKTRITKDQAELIQRECFRAGIGWSSSGQNSICFPDRIYGVYLNRIGNRRLYITYGEREENFQASPAQEVTNKEFIKALGRKK